jgi:hypothetical protein
MVQLQELKEKLAAANAKNEEALAALETERAAHTDTTSRLAGTEAALTSTREVAADLQRYLDDAREANGLLASSLATKMFQLAESKARLEAVDEQAAELKAQLAAAQAGGITVEATEQAMVVSIEVEATGEPVVVSSDEMGAHAMESSEGNEAIMSEMDKVPQHPVPSNGAADTTVMVVRKASGHMSSLECELQHAANTEMDMDMGVSVGCLPLPSYRKLLAWGSRHLLRRSKSGQTGGSAPDELHVPSDSSQTVGEEPEVTGS